MQPADSMVFLLCVMTTNWVLSPNRRSMLRNRSTFASSSGASARSGPLRPHRAAVPILRPGDARDVPPMSLWDRFRRGLERTREALVAVAGSALGRRTVDAATVEVLEEALLAADVGPVTTD